MRKRKTILDDGFQAYLTEGATFIGEPGIPVLMDLDNIQIPRDIIPFTKARNCPDKRKICAFLYA